MPLGPLASTILALLVASPALACIQGRHLPPVRPAFAIPVSLSAPAPSAEQLRFTPPPLEPFPLPLAPANLPPPAPLSEAEARVTYARIVATFEAHASSAPSADDVIDYSASLIFLGRSADAIGVLLALEKKHPGLYATAANLGTAYELTGRLDRALTWIRVGIERDPSSHAGTEWLHVAILEAKLHLQRDASWLTRHSVLDAAPAHFPEDTLRAIDYQLNERLRFVAPTDPIVSDLFFQAALRTPTVDMPARRNFYLDESLRFGALRAAEIAALRVPPGS